MPAENATLVRQCRAESAMMGQVLRRVRQFLPSGQVNSLARHLLTPLAVAGPLVGMGPPHGGSRGFGEKSLTGSLHA